MKMKRPLMIATIGLLMSTFTQAQNAVLTGSGQYSSGGVSLMYTVGDLTVKNLLGEGASVGQGFLSAATGASVLWVGASEATGYELLVYPNPTTDHLHVVGSATDLTGLTFRIIDAAGRALQVVENRTGERIDLTTSGLPSGFYTLIVSGALRKQMNYTVIKH